MTKITNLKVRNKRYYVAQKGFKYVTLYAKPLYDVNFMRTKDNIPTSDITKAHKCEVVNDDGYCKWYLLSNLELYQIDVQVVDKLATCIDIFDTLTDTKRAIVMDPFDHITGHKLKK